MWKLLQRLLKNMHHKHSRKNKHFWAEDISNCGLSDRCYAIIIPVSSLK